MAKITINNLEVEASRHGQWSVFWDDSAARYHFWFDPGVEPKRDFILYKNPPHGIKHRDPGDFPTRHLDPTSKTWAPTIAEVWARIEREDLIEKARDALNAEAIAERRRMEEAAAIHRKQQAGPELYEALRSAMLLLEAANRRCTQDTVLILNCRAALAKAEGRDQ